MSERVVDCWARARWHRAEVAGKPWARRSNHEIGSSRIRRLAPEKSVETVTSLHAQTEVLRSARPHTPWVSPPLFGCGRLETAKVLSHRARVHPFAYRAHERLNNRAAELDADLLALSVGGHEAPLAESSM